MWVSQPPEAYLQLYGADGTLQLPHMREVVEREIEKVVMMKLTSKDF